MYDSKQLARTFVEGNVQNSIIATFQILEKLIDQSAPVMENVYARTKVFGSKPFSSIRKKDIEGYTRSNLDGARRGLYWYSITMNSLGNRLALLSSNFGLREFLLTNKVQAEAIGEIQREVTIYWEDTYEPLLDKLQIVHELLIQLHTLLKSQIEELERLPETNYFQALESSAQIDEWFLEERATFWKLVDAVKVTKQEISLVRGLFYAQRKKAIAVLRAHLLIIKRGVLTEIKESEGLVRKTIAVLSYLAGVLLVYYSLKDLLVKKTLKGTLGKLNASLDRKRIRKIEGILEEHSMNFLEESTEAGIHALLNAI